MNIDSVTVGGYSRSRCTGSNASADPERRVMRLRR